MIGCDALLCDGQHAQPLTVEDADAREDLRPQCRRERHDAALPLGKGADGKHLLGGALGDEQAFLPAGDSHAHAAALKIKGKFVRFAKIFQCGERKFAPLPSSCARSMTATSIRFFRPV